MILLPFYHTILIDLFSFTHKVFSPFKDRNHNSRYIQCLLVCKLVPIWFSPNFYGSDKDLNSEKSSLGDIRKQVA